MATPAAETKLTPAALQRETRSFYLRIPFLVLVPVAYWLLFQAMGVPMRWGAFTLGAVGWLVALNLRGPIALVVKRFWPDQMTTIIGWASGPCEELVRPLALAISSWAIPWAAALGQGWAAIECLLTIVQGLVTLKFAARDDEKGRLVRERLESMMSQSTKAIGVAPVVERITASAFHIGATLLVAAHPLLFVALIPLHSLMNMTSLALVKRGGMWLTQLWVGVWGVGTLLLGLWACGKL